MLRSFVLFFCCLCLGLSGARGQFNHYFGNIHSHTAYSDGNKDSAASGISTPGASFWYARNSYHIDFWGISEHNHYTAAGYPGMLLQRYAPGLYQADTASQNGFFIALYGLEFGTISTGGHVVSYGWPGLVGWDSVGGVPKYAIYCAKGDYDSYWTKANTYAQTFSTLAHPQSGDFNDLLLSAPFKPSADSQIVGLSVRSGSAFSTTNNYNDPPATLYELSFRRALAKGYHVAPAIDHDNHNTTFGRTSQGRTVLLATQLHRDSLIAAYKARRFYASDDWNTQVMFTVNGAVMGSSVLAPQSSQIQVYVSDPDPGDSVSSIQVFSGRPGSGLLSQVLHSVSGSNQLNYTHIPAAGDSVYYYARIQQADGDLIWTAPVWVKQVNLVLPVQWLTVDGRATPAGSQIRFDVVGEHANDRLYLEHAAEDDDLFSPLRELALTGDGRVESFSVLHAGALHGIQRYRVRYAHANGALSYSPVVSVHFPEEHVQYSFSPVPVTESFTLRYRSAQSGAAFLRVYNADGILVMQAAYRLAQGENELRQTMHGFPPGLYYAVLQSAHTRLVDIPFVKQ
jgi:hypothetical protein